MKSSYHYYQNRLLEIRAWVNCFTILGYLAEINSRKHLETLITIAEIDTYSPPNRNRQKHRGGERWHSAIPTYLMNRLEMSLEKITLA